MAKKQVANLKKSFHTLIVAALGFVAALVWKDAILAWVKPLMAGDGTAALTWTALIVTVVVLLLTWLFGKLLGEE